MSDMVLRDPDWRFERLIGSSAVLSHPALAYPVIVCNDLNQMDLALYIKCCGPDVAWFAGEVSVCPVCSATADLRGVTSHIALLETIVASNVDPLTGTIVAHDLYSDLTRLYEAWLDWFDSPDSQADWEFEVRAHIDAHRVGGPPDE